MKHSGVGMKNENSISSKEGKVWEKMYIFITF